MGSAANQGNRYYMRLKKMRSLSGFKQRYHHESAVLIKQVKRRSKSKRRTSIIEGGQTREVAAATTSQSMRSKLDYGIT